MGRRYSLTAEERILFHLYDYIQFEDEFEAPPEVTQEGISRGALIQRKHVPRSLKKLISRGLIFERLSHVKGAKQRLRVYFLTDEGKEEAKKIIKSLSGKMVIVKERGRTKSVPFLEYCFTHQVGKNPLEVLMQLEGMEEESIKEHEVKPPSEKDRIKIYREMLRKAWEDGKLTRDEVDLLKEARKMLGISESEHSRLEEEVIRENKGRTGVDVEKVLNAVIKTALKDGMVSEDEEAIIKSLLDALDLPEEKRKEILKELPRVGGEEKKREKLKIYKTAMAEALKDGHVSRDELALILMLKKTLGITEEEHLRILRELGR
ncbi:MAG: hypothetical protein J7L88_00625 [Thermoplasmata archaeon]|nr:hypothetical protein [Thermoplasmata archaeon]